MRINAADKFRGEVNSGRMPRRWARLAAADEALSYTGSMRSDSRTKPLAHSRDLARRAEEFFPGGVNSPVRAFRAVGGHPPFIEMATATWTSSVPGAR
jgi:glutamate-1-semialdehyde 2,1-aminomutase